MKTYQDFLDTLGEVEVCAYCGGENVCDVRGCCGEVHTETAYQNEIGDIFPEDDLESEYQSWLKKQEKAS